MREIARVSPQIISMSAEIVCSIFVPMKMVSSCTVQLHYSSSPALIFVKFHTVVVALNKNITEKARETESGESFDSRAPRDRWTEKGRWILEATRSPCP